MAVLNTTSPETATSAPNETPGQRVPSARTRVARFCSSSWMIFLGARRAARILRGGMDRGESDPSGTGRLQPSFSPCRTGEFNSLEEGVLVRWKAGDMSLASLTG
eukprot:scaffold249274_cov31-Tisochrysis_lutea.AAC.7